MIHILYYRVSEILVKNQKLMTLIIHGTEAPLYKKRYILTSPCIDQIRLMLDNKKHFNMAARTLVISPVYRGQVKKKLEVNI